MVAPFFFVGVLAVMAGHWRRMEIVCGCSLLCYWLSSSSLSSLPSLSSLSSLVRISTNPKCGLHGRKFVSALHNTCVTLQGIMTVLSTVSSPGVTVP
ncbi:hypothetical protein M438DRAFT_31365 [Aureobasidium pullulans EXF-150]|uniref:Uncharacterized protein n=1 Tax=Aureobasidium pullulans EXF-150 TaxID=1043002 RepID=A0A074XMY8_AURPU|nr:uncharacterized protein M438DRAFT_31365 [Aureobasidium pullulans EXF-150]KEQ83367.1 hypothetical protein M438DRAFT_31365 [Aureobasidium pullulans EXF-150]